MVEEFIAAYSGNPTLWLISGIAFAIGYAEYVYSTLLLLREKKGPFPLWMHTFYFAHDLTGAVVFGLLATQHQFFWVFSAASVALMLWNLFEIFNLFMAIRHERAESWPRADGSVVSVNEAVLRIIGQIALMICVVNLFRVFMDDVVMFKWFAFTNILIAVAPGYLWARRGTRDGASIGLAIVILVGTINTFLPPGFGMWTTALSYFDQPWFYLTGVVTTAFAVRNLVMLLRMPPKTDPRAVW